LTAEELKVSLFSLDGERKKKNFVQC
jgi:hypothetical protein